MVRPRRGWRTGEWVRMLEVGRLLIAVVELPCYVPTSELHLRRTSLSADPIERGTLMSRRPPPSSSLLKIPTTPYPPPSPSSEHSKRSPRRLERLLPLTRSSPRPPPPSPPSPPQPRPLPALRQATATPSTPSAQPPRPFFARASSKSQRATRRCAVGRQERVERAREIEGARRRQIGRASCRERVS